ncbi:enoyl-CoA hydratase [Alicycliphilus sp. B1]|nr:enoyl-CoA hydratase [Alicycliphilus sp. B1]
MQAEDSEAWVLASRVGPVARIHLNRGDARNPLGAEMVQALSAAVGEASGQSGVRVILLTAAGPGVQRRGQPGQPGRQAGLPRRGPTGATPSPPGNRRYGEFLTQLVNVPQVTVACVQGAAMGGGAGLACAVDIAVGSPEARFGFPEAAIGLVPGQILPFVAARLGLPAARRLVLTGRRIDRGRGPPHRPAGLRGRLAPGAGRAHAAGAGIRRGHGAAGLGLHQAHAGPAARGAAAGQRRAAGLPGRGRGAVRRPDALGGDGGRERRPRKAARPLE